MASLSIDWSQLTSDSIPMTFMGMDPLLLDDAGMINEGGSLNIPWLVQLSSRMGNACTSALAMNSNVLCEIEAWEGMGGGGNQPNWNGPWAHAQFSGGISIWW
jgi:hypothetical protein